MKDAVIRAGLTLHEKVTLIVVGVTAGLLMLGITYFVLNFKSRSAGVEFENLADLRSQMLSEKAINKTDSRGVSLASIVTPHSDDQIIYTLLPNREVTFQRAPTKINSCGMRDREYKVSKNVNTFRIALLGDSFTFGWGVNESESFAKVLEDNLQKRSQNSKIQVLNFGVPGYSTFQEVASFLESGSDFQPDAVLVFFIENDFGLPFFVKSLVEPNGKIMASSQFASLQYKANHKSKAQEYQNQLNVDPNQALKQLSQYANSRGIKVYLAINPRKGWAQVQKKLWILNKNSNIEVIKLRRSFMEIVDREKIDPSRLSLKGDPHPSPLKHKMLGDLLSTYFMEYEL